MTVLLTVRRYHRGVIGTATYVVGEASDRILTVRS
jgi:hypothetical protein